MLVGDVRGTIEDNRTERNDNPDSQVGLNGGLLIADVMGIVTVRNNAIDANGTEGVLIFGSEVELISNQITRNGASGVVLIDRLFRRDMAAEVVLINNTIAGNERGVVIAPPSVPHLKPAASITNSIIAENVTDLVDVEFDRVRYSLIGDGTFAGQNHNIGGTPAFVNSVEGNYRLSAGSPAIDAGTSKLDELPDFDLLGSPRVFDGDGDGEAQIDLGAYEFQGGQPIAIEISPTVATLAVNQIQEFVVTLVGTTDLRVIWQVNGIPNGSDEVGTITPDGIYTAPAALPATNPVTIEVISQRDTKVRTTATVTIVPGVQPGAALVSGVPVEGEIPPGDPGQRTILWGLENQYQIVVPADAIELILQLEGVDPSRDIDLAMRHNRPLQIQSRRLVADFRSDSPESSETIVVNLTTNPPIQSGTYYIVVGNYDPAAAKFTLSAAVRTGVRPGVAIPLQSGETVNAPQARRIFICGMLIVNTQSKCRRRQRN